MARHSMAASSATARADQIAGIAALADPTRRALYEHVVAQDDAVSREAAADAVGVAVHVAKFQLDRLEADGLLVSEYRRPEGRGGPGAGRPAKHYRRAPAEFAVTLPGREYVLAGTVLADAIMRTTTGQVPLPDALKAAAHAAGKGLVALNASRRGRPLERVRDALAPHGYEPRIVGSCLTLANCPFHALATDYTALICGMNVDLISGVVAALGIDTPVRLNPSEDRCCVTVSDRRGA